MWRLALGARLGGVALVRPLAVGSALSGGLAAPALLRARSITLPSQVNLQQAGCGGPTKPSRYDSESLLAWLPEGLPDLARMAHQWLGCPATSAGVLIRFTLKGKRVEL